MRRAQIGIAILVLIHLLFFRQLLGIGENLVFFLSTSATMLLGLYYHEKMSKPRFALYLAISLFFLGIVVLSPRKAPIVSLYLLLFSALFRIPRLLAHFGLFVLTVELLPEYFAQVWPVLFLLLEVLHHAVIKEREQLVGWFFLLGFFLLGGILVPVLGMVFGCSVQTLAVTAKEQVVLNALGTSLLTASIATLVALLFGVPLAYALARTQFWGREIMLSLVDLPILVPQSVAGVALLLVFGPKTTIGHHLSSLFGLEVVNSLFAIIVAQVFVSAPFLIRASMAAFLKVNKRLEYVSRSLGASQARTFASVTLPLALPGIFAGCILTWARAISEAGTVILLANEPFTISTLVNFRFQQYGTKEAAPVASLLVIVCLFLFLMLNLAKYMPSWRDFQEVKSDDA